MDIFDSISGKNGYGNSVVNSRSTTKPDAPTEKNAPESTADNSSVSLSASVTHMKTLTQSLAKEPSFDQAKVDHIKSLIAQGQYTIDPNKIAAKFSAMEHTQS